MTVLPYYICAHVKSNPNCAQLSRSCTITTREDGLTYTPIILINQML